MGEGHTPLIPSTVHGFGLRFKLENLNPSGSYKDRFIAAEMTRILKTGAQAVIATSSGNTGSALAAYSARYRVRCTIFVNEYTPAGKLVQMRSYGARVMRLRAFGEDARVSAAICAELDRLSRERGVPLVISAFRFCPEGMRGVSSLAFELREQAPEVDHVFVPVGGGGLYCAVAEGFLMSGGKVPRVHAVQPEGSSTIVAALDAGRTEIVPVTSTTRVSGLSVPFDIDGARALTNLAKTGGAGLTVSDEEVFGAQARMLSEEGIYAEPAGAAAYAGFEKARRLGLIGEGETSVCLVTGHGSKDPASIEQAAAANREELREAAELPELV
jgi:threonine synthase